MDIRPLNPQFIFDIRSAFRVKAFDTHPVKQLLAFVTNNNIIQIWNFEHKICIRSFVANQLDGSVERISEIKQIKFYDRDVVQSSSTENFMRKFLFKKKNFKKDPCLIIITSERLYFYHYQSDKTEMFLQFQTDTRGGFRCLEFIDNQYIAIGGEQGVKIIDLKLQQVVKNLKSYHSKLVNLMFSYKQNQSERPRLIASSLDGTLACWNADTAVETPTFKFLMMKKGKQLTNSNDGQELLSLTYDQHEYHFVTVTEDYITVWSSLNGMELNRYKNASDTNKTQIKELVYFGFPTLPKSTYLGHQRGTEIYIITLSEKSHESNTVVSKLDSSSKLTIFETQLFCDLKSMQENSQLKIIQLLSNRVGELTVATTSGIYIIAISQDQIQKIVFEPTFYCNLNFIQSKEFIDDQGIYRKMTNLMHEKLKAYEQLGLVNESNNYMYLICLNKYLICSLCEIQIQKNEEGVEVINFFRLIYYQKEWSQMFIKAKQYKFDKEFNWDDSFLQVSSSGKFLFVLNNRNSYYVILQINNKSLLKESDILDGGKSQDTLHILSQFDRHLFGCAVSGTWSSNQDQLITISPINEQGALITVEEKIDFIQSGTFFKTRTQAKSQVFLSAQVKGYVICIYTWSGSNFTLRKIQNFESPLKIYNLVNFYLITTVVTNTQLQLKNKPQFNTNLATLCQFNDNIATTFGVFAEPIYAKSSIDGKITVFVYQTNMHIFKVQNNRFQLYRIIEEKVQDIYFWENLMFYITSSDIKMVIFDSFTDCITIIIASQENPLSVFNLCSFLKETQDYLYYESIQPEIQKRPSGLLKILTIFDQRLVIINHSEEQFYLDLRHPFIEFVMNIQYEQFDTCIELSNKLDKNNHKILCEILLAKGAVSHALALQGLTQDDKIQIEEQFIGEKKNPLGEIQSLNLIQEIFNS